MRTTCFCLIVVSSLAAVAVAQDPAESAAAVEAAPIDAPVAAEVAEPAELAADEEATADDEAPPAAEEAAASEPAVEPAEPSDEAAGSDDEDDDNQDFVPEEADADDPAEEAPADGEAEADEAPAVPKPQWLGLLERAPAFLAVTHRAAVHLPIGLWLFGALFVVIGVVFPRWRNQVPVACLIGGTLGTIASAATGWWNAHYEYGEPWAWADGVGDLSEHLVRHRWTGIALAVAGVFLSVLALISQRDKSRGLGVVWRLGLLALAAAVAWEGHLGGELSMGEGFFEEAYEAWVNPAE